MTDFATESRLTFIRRYLAAESDTERKRKEQLEYLKRTGKWLGYRRDWNWKPLLKEKSQ